MEWLKQMHKHIIKFSMDFVNETYTQSKKSDWNDIAKFAVLLIFKIIATLAIFGGLFWIIRHF